MLVGSNGCVSIDDLRLIATFMGWNEINDRSYIDSSDNVYKSTDFAGWNNLIPVVQSVYEVLSKEDTSPEVDDLLDELTKGITVNLYGVYEVLEMCVEGINMYNEIVARADNDRYL